MSVVAPLFHHPLGLSVLGSLWSVGYVLGGGLIRFGRLRDDRSRESEHENQAKQAMTKHKISRQRGLNTVGVDGKTRDEWV